MSKQSNYLDKKQNEKKYTVKLRWHFLPIISTIMIILSTISIPNSSAINVSGIPNEIGYYDMSTMRNGKLQNMASNDNNIDGINYGTSVLESGYMGYGKTFDGNDRIDISGLKALWNHSISISIWFRTTNGNGRLFTQEKSDYDAPFVAYLQSNDLWYFTSNSTPNQYSYKNTAIKGQDNIWHNYILTCQDGITWTIYIDGIQRAESSTSDGTHPWIRGIKTSTAPVLIGASYYGSVYGYFFTGFIDEIHIFNRAITLNEVKLLYRLFLNPPQTSVEKSHGYSYVPLVNYTRNALFNWTLKTNASGLNVSFTSGVISGTVNITGIYYVNLSGVKSAGNFVYRNYTLTVYSVENGTPKYFTVIVLVIGVISLGIFLFYFDSRRKEK